MKICPKCNNPHEKNGIFCSRACANSRIRTEEIKKKVSEKLKGRIISQDHKEKISLTKRNGIPKIFTICKVCGKNTKTYHRKTCSDICYKIANKTSSQLNPKCGGQKHTHRTKIYNIKNEIFVAESSFEVQLAKNLNEQNIYWIRPSFIFYNDKNNNIRRYYPDFYLPYFDVYIDPKNDFLIKTDIDKIFRVANQNNLKIFILGEKFLNINIKQMVGDNGTAPLYPVCKTGVLLLN